MDHIDVNAFFESRAVRYCQFVPAVLVVYEYFLQFSNEVDLFWRKRWSVAKCLFLWSRYYSMLFNIANAYFFMAEDASIELCDKFFKWQEAGLALQVITTHAILELRLYAMYGSSKKVLIFFILLAAAEAAVMGVLVGLPKKGLIMTNEPSPGLFICADADPYHDPWIAFNWTSALVVESILLFMSLYKAWSYCYPTSDGGHLLRQLTKDSALYFFFMFWTYLGNQVVWFINKLTLTELGTGFSFGIGAILSHRILISVRAVHYKDDSVHEAELPSMRFGNDNPTASELETFAILTGHYGPED